MFLRRQLEGRGESRMRAWAALSLGVMMHRLAELRLPLPEEPAEAMRAPSPTSMASRRSAIA